MCETAREINSVTYTVKTIDLLNAIDRVYWIGYGSLWNRCSSPPRVHVGTATGFGNHFRSSDIELDRLESTSAFQNYYVMYSGLSIRNILHFDGCIGKSLLQK